MQLSKLRFKIVLKSIFMSGFGLFKWVITNWISTKNSSLFLLFFVLLHFGSPPPHFTLFYFFLFSLLYMLFSLTLIFRILSRKKFSFSCWITYLKTWKSFFSWFLQNLSRKFPSFVKNSRKENIPFNIIFYFPTFYQSFFIYLEK